MARKDPEQRREYNKAYYGANKDHIRSQQSVYHKAAQGVISARKAKDYLENKEERQEQMREWRKANPEKLPLYENRRRARKIGSGGSHTPEERKLKFQEWFNRCFYCGIGGKLTVDHDLPLSRGGSDSIDNILPCCKPCNSKKGTRTAAEYLEKIGLPRLVGF